MPEKPTDVSAVRGLTDAQLGERYTSLNKNQESSIKHQASREEEQVKQSTRADLAGLKDLIEEEMVSRLDAKALLSTYLDRNGKSISSEQIDKGIRKLFADKFGLQLSEEDLQSLRDDLPIIDEVRNGKYIAYGKKDEKGNELAHAVAVDSVSLQHDPESGKYTFQYGINVQVVNGDSAFSQLVDNTSISLGQSVLADHRFEVQLSTNRPARKPSVQLKIAEGSNENNLLATHLGVTIRPQKAGEPFLILIDKKFYQEAKSDPEIKDQLRQVVAHEIGHVAGFVEDREHDSHDNKVGAIGLDKKSAEALKVSSKISPDKITEIDNRPEKEFVAKTIRQTLDEAFTLKAFNEKKTEWETTYQVELNLTQVQLDIVKDAIIQIAQNRKINLNATIPDTSTTLGTFTGVVGSLFKGETGDLTEAQKLQPEMDAKMQLLAQYLGKIKELVSKEPSYFNQGKLKWEFISSSPQLQNLLGSSKTLATLLSTDPSQFDAALQNTKIKEELVQKYNEKLQQQNTRLNETQKKAVEVARAKDTDIKEAKNLEGVKTALGEDYASLETGLAAAQEKLTQLSGSPLKDVNEKNYKEKVRESIVAFLYTNGISPEIASRQQIAERYFDEKIAPEFGKFEKGQDQFKLTKTPEGKYTVEFSQAPTVKTTTSGNETEDLPGPLKGIQDFLSKMGPLGKVLAPLLSIFLVFQRFGDSEYLSTWVQSLFSDDAKTKLKNMNAEYDYWDGLSKSLSEYVEKNKTTEPIATLQQKGVIPQKLSREFTRKVRALKLTVPNTVSEEAKEKDPDAPVPDKIEMPPEQFIPLLFKDNSDKWLKAVETGSLTKDTFEKVAFDLLKGTEPAQPQTPVEKVDEKNGAYQLLNTLKAGDGEVLPAGAVLLGTVPVLETGVYKLRMKLNERVFEIQQKSDGAGTDKPLQILEFKSDTSQEEVPVGLKMSYENLAAFKEEFKSDVEAPSTSIDAIKKQLAHKDTWFELQKLKPNVNVSFLKIEKDKAVTVYAKIDTNSGGTIGSVYRKFDDQNKTWSADIAQKSLNSELLDKIKSDKSLPKYTEYYKESNFGTWFLDDNKDFPNSYYGVIQGDENKLYWKNEKNELYVSTPDSNSVWTWRSATAQESTKVKEKIPDNLLKNIPELQKSLFYADAWYTLNGASYLRHDPNYYVKVEGKYKQFNATNATWGEAKESDILKTVQEQKYNDLLTQAKASPDLWTTDARYADWKVGVLASEAASPTLYAKGGKSPLLYVCAKEKDVFVWREANASESEKIKGMKDPVPA